ncbi:hypothetical protein J7L06_07270 [Candidatus Bathyarchaeota archaeon]|nr:hypothetical protein [Candidatus Bathyarchaeota archaeon]
MRLRFVSLLNNPSESNANSVKVSVDDECLTWVERVNDDVDKFYINISYKYRTEITERTLEVVEAFGIGVDEREFVIYDDVELKIGPTDIVYITGDSGSGKSVLLRAMKKDLGDEAIDIDE